MAEKKPSESVYPELQSFSNDIPASAQSQLQNVPINSNHETESTSAETTPSSYGSFSSPLTTNHFTAHRKGWKGMSSLEKSLSVALGVVSTLCVGLMIAVIVVGVKLSKEDCINVSPPTTTGFPTRSPTTPPPYNGSTPNICDTTLRPRPPKKGEGTTTASPIDKVPASSNSRPIMSNGAECLATEDYNNATICLTPECFRKAGRLIESIDFAVDPCQNFYQFACGNWIKNNPVPDNKQSWDQQGKLEGKQLKIIKHILEMDVPKDESRSILFAREFYHSCMHPQDDEVGKAEMRVLLEDMTTNLDNDTDPMSYFASMLGGIRRDLDGNYVISLDVDVDGRDPLEQAIYLDHPTSGLHMLLNMMDLTSANGIDNRNDSEQGQGFEEMDSKLLEFYTDLSQKLWSLVFPQDMENVEYIISDLLEFERNLTDMIRPTGISDRVNDPEAMYNPLSEVNDTQLSPTMAAWLEEFVDEIFKEIGNGTSSDGSVNAILPNKDGERPGIILRDPSYFQHLEGKLNGTKSETIENYLKLRIILSHGYQAGNAFQDLFTQFKKKVLGRDFCTPRWETCSRQTNELFGWAISTKFIQHANNITDKSQLNQTVNYLKAALNETLNGVDWITSNETRQDAQEKLDALQTFIAFPDWQIDEPVESSFVGEFYSDLKFSDPSNYFQNYIETTIWLSKKRLSEILEQTISGDYEWPKFDSPTAMKSSYSQNRNHLVLPAGAIDWMSLSTDSLFPSVHFGTLGMLMAQVMLPAFLEEGRYHGADGRLYSWWDNETAENYMSLSSCFNDQYTNLVSGENMDSQKLTNRKLRENVLNNAALSISYLAYHSYSFEQASDELLLPGLQDYTPEQLFYLSFAQNQCSSVERHAFSSQEINANPGEILVRSTLQNSVEFARHWQCPLPHEESTCRIF